MNSYSLAILPPSGGTLLELVECSRFSKFEYTRKINDVGTFVAEFADSNDPLYESIDRYSIIDVVRNGEVDDTYLLWGKSITYEGGVLTKRISGVHINTVLEGRFVVLEEGDAETVSGYADVVIKDLVKKWIGPSASGYRMLPGLHIDSYKYTGIAQETRPGRKRLLTLLQEIADSGNLDFYIKHTGHGDFLFYAQGTYGENKTYSANYRNESGKIVILSPRMGNVDRLHIQIKEADVDYAQVGGEGKGDEREVVLVSGADAGLTKFSIRDAFVDARDSSGDGLSAAGNSFLFQNGRRTTAEIDISTSSLSDYGTVWNLGDRVTVDDGSGFREDFRVSSVKVSVSGIIESIMPVLEDV